MCKVVLDIESPRFQDTYEALKCKISHFNSVLRAAMKAKLKTKKFE